MGCVVGKGVVVPSWGLGCACVGGFLSCVGEGLVCVFSFGVWVLLLYMCSSFCGEVLYAFVHLGRAYWCDLRDGVVGSCILRRVSIGLQVLLGHSARAHSALGDCLAVLSVGRRGEV